MSLRRISIHADVAGELCAYDLAVCAQSPAADLLPTLVDMVGAVGEGVRWELRSTTGAPLDESMSLADNGVCDGDVVTLGAAYDAPHGLLGVEPVRVLADAGGSGRFGSARLVEFCWSWLMLAAAVALAWTGLKSAPVSAAIAAGCCATATSWRAVVIGSPAMAVTGALGAGAVGFIVVPGTDVSNLLLCAAAVFAVSVSLARAVPDATTALTAAGSAAALVAAVAAVTVAASLTVATAGAALTVGGIGLLALAPRGAALLAGVQTGHLVERPNDLARRTRTAHGVLTGLIAGSGAAAAAGTGLVAVAAPSRVAIAFVVVTALLLLVRVRTQVDAARRIALAVAGLVSATAALIVVAVASPDAACWVAVSVVAIPGVMSAVRTGPAIRRAIDGLDYLCAALLVPLACWVIGLYSVARDWVFT